MMIIIDDKLAAKEESRNLHAAIEWLITQTPPHDIRQIEEASQRFNLSPVDEEFLIRHLKTSCTNKNST